MSVEPRFIRVGKAPAYLGMCRAVFESLVRPHLTELPIGKQGIAFDRKELDRWADEYAASARIDKPACAGNDQPRSERRHSTGGTKLWGVNRLLASPKGVASGTSINRSAGMGDFAKALALVRGKKPSASSSTG
ncbi:hypothetical protein RBI22_15375 [Alcaligenaceae bacterium C4P045]|nr:hypothetical protein [Alcaligenaceae bacterium C4P045]